MERIWLVRENKKSGPYSKNQLKDSCLQPYDLYWVVGKCQHLENVKSVLTLIDVKTNADSCFQFINPNSHVFVRLPQPLSISCLHADPIVELKVKYEYPKQKIKNKQKERRQELIQENRTWTACLVLSFMFLGYLTHELLSSSPSVFPISYKTKKTQPIALPEDKVSTKSADYTYQNALGLETIMEEKLYKADKKTKPFDWRKQVRLTSNEYKRDFLGSIKEVEILLTNHSSFVIDKALIEVQFLKPNGKLIAKERYMVRSIPPHYTKQISLPPTKGSFKVKYQLIDAQEKVFKPITSFT